MLTSIDRTWFSWKQARLGRRKPASLRRLQERWQIGENHVRSALTTGHYRLLAARQSSQYERGRHLGGMPRDDIEIQPIADHQCRAWLGIEQPHRLQHNPWRRLANRLGAPAAGIFERGHQRAGSWLEAI